jgi:two-component system sensor histidine kinase TorS
VVEDDPATRLVAQEFLTRLGHKAYAVRSGYEAIAQFGKHKPDLVLMDISMPDLDGIATAERLRALPGAKAVAIIAMSAHVFKEEVDRYLTSGMDAYVAKPLTLETIAKAIMSATTKSYNSVGPGLDPVQLDADLKLIGRNAVSRIFAIVEETLPQRFAAMHEAMLALDFDKLEKFAHATYSTAASAGFTELCQEARALELSARNRDGRRSALGLSRCEASYHRAMEKAERLILAG